MVAVLFHSIHRNPYILDSLVAAGVILGCLVLGPRIKKRRNRKNNNTHDQASR